MDKIQAAVLGADDPEMRAIEGVLRAAGIRPEYAAILHTTPSADGVVKARRVGPGDAYRADCMLVESARGPEAVALWSADDQGVLWVECAPAGVLPQIRADHHRAGDPGFGRGPAEFWRASSLGQVCSVLGVAPTLARPFEATELMFIAAADHCLAAALRGACPGVDPDALLEWRLTAPGSPHTSEPDGRDGGRRPVPPEVVLDRAEAARMLLAAAARTNVAEDDEMPDGRRVMAADLRSIGSATVGLPLADVACRLGVAYVMLVREGFPERTGGRVKVVLGGCGEGSAPGVVPMAAWESWCRAQGYYTGEVYGDPVRGYAGCYIAPREAQS